MKYTILSYRFWAGILSALAVVIGLGSPVYAADPPLQESITLSPVSKRLTLDSGTSQRDSFKIFNDGDVDYDFIVYARPYYVKDSSYTADFSSTKANADAYKWVQFDQARYHAKAGETIEVGFSVLVPAKAAPGGHYGILFAETQASNADASGSSLQRNKRVGAVLYANVNGNYINRGSIDSIKTDFFQTSTPLRSSLRFSNNGNTDFTAKTTYTITDIFGSKKFVQSQEYVVLPDTSRDIVLQWQQAPQLGFFKVAVSAQLLDQTEQSSKYVLIAPVWLYPLVSFVLAGGILYAVVRRRR